MTFAKRDLNITDARNDVQKWIGFKRNLFRSMPGSKHEGSSNRSKRIFQPRFLLVAAAIWHLSIAVTVFTVGKYQVLPSQFYPNGIGKFASDGLIYQEQCVELRSILRTEGWKSWATWPTQLHVRLYSLPLAATPESVGFNVLTIEPLNLIYYLAILILVFTIGKKAFDERSGLLAAAIVGLWPTLVLHTTQLLRDPLLILAVLVFVWSIVEVFQPNLSWRRGLLLGLAAVAAIVCIRIVRLPMWFVLVAGVVTGITLLTLAAIKRKRVVLGAAIFAVLVAAAIFITPRFSFRNQQELRAERIIMPEAIQKLPLQDQIAARREAWKYKLDSDGNIVVAEDGSRIDAEVRMSTFKDIVRHVPRGIVVGLFAPFPNMWIRAGNQVGYGGRILSGFETILTYVIECLALFGWWGGRRLLSTWFLMLFSAFGVVGLGLVVTNIGALYRLRYPFWVVLVIVGAGGITFLIRVLCSHSTSQIA